MEMFLELNYKNGIIYEVKETEGFKDREVSFDDFLKQSEKGFIPNWLSVRVTSEEQFVTLAERFIIKELA